jgi:hypothetical protein
MNTAPRCTTNGAAGNGLDTTTKYLQRTTSDAAGYGRAQRSNTSDAQRGAPRAANDLGTTIKSPRATAGIGLGTTIK